MNDMIGTRPEVCRDSASRFIGRLIAISVLMLLLGTSVRRESVRDDAAPDAHVELTSRVIVGYQGWFRAVGDGTEIGFRHYGANGKFEPGVCSIDYWPDLDEYKKDERFDTPFGRADGSAAQVFSSVHPHTVLRHFEWMRDYGIGGAMLQRFAVDTKDERIRASCNQVLANVRHASRQTGVPWALMYDLSLLRQGEVESVLIPDLRRLLNKAEDNVRDDPMYLHHRGQPVIGIWGAGFNDGRKYTLEEIARLLRALKDDETIGGNAIMLGVPYWFRTLEHDAVTDTKLHKVIELADVVSPWSVGRYRDPDGAARLQMDRIPEDLKWAEERNLDYMPVVFPGFSWHNLKKAQHVDAPLDEIPRLRGQFMWRQFVEAVNLGADMIYVAMFDEMDEGTCVFKVSSEPPVGSSPFLTYGDLPTDHYLWLVGQGARLLRGEIPPSDDLPARH